MRYCDITGGFKFKDPSIVLSPQPKF